MRILEHEIIKKEPVGGGSIASSFKVIAKDGSVFFWKTTYHGRTTAFITEAQALQEISAHKSIQTPRLIDVDEQQLVLEWIEAEKPTKAFWLTFGKQLARMHIQLHESFGFPSDNHIGTTPQQNPLIHMKDISWARYFLDFRIKPMLSHPRLLRDQELQSAFQTAEPRLRQQLEVVQEPPSLLHGDLWSGNFICGPGQTPYLIDPASYYGHREADLAMTELFGGFAPEFYKAYREEFPLQPNYERRKKIYNLYHLLNHWILFGESYRKGCLEILLGA